jgi:hypothetical protein
MEVNIEDFARALTVVVANRQNAAQTSATILQKKDIVSASIRRYQPIAPIIALPLHLALPVSQLLALVSGICASHAPLDCLVLQREPVTPI